LDFGADLLAGQQPARSRPAVKHPDGATEKGAPTLSILGCEQRRFAVILKITAFRAMLVVFRHWSAWPDPHGRQAPPLRRRMYTSVKSQSAIESTAKLVELRAHRTISCHEAG
jgi:hypothetical protein